MSILTPEDRERIHRGSLDVLETLGVRVDDADILTLLRRHGAKDGGEADTVRLPRALVADCLAACPSTARLSDRHGYAVEVGSDGGTVFWTGNALHVTEGRTRCELTTGDLARLTRVADACPEVNGMVGTSVADVPPPARDVVGFTVMAAHTAKHLRPCIFTPAGAGAIVEMARVLSGGVPLAARPLVSFGYSIVSPLRWSATGLGVFRDALADGVALGVLLQDGLIAAMDEIGRRFEVGDCYIPEMLRSRTRWRPSSNVHVPFMPTSSPSRTCGTRRTADMGMHVLVIENDSTVARMVRGWLTAAGYDVHVAVDGPEGIERALGNGYAAIVVDFALPSMSGVDVPRALRARGLETPILMVTARDVAVDRVAGFDAGADDCLPSSFVHEELLAHLRAVLRRRPELDAAAPLVVADLVLDRSAHEVRRAGRPICLTAQEFALLEYLMRRAGRVSTRAEIAEYAWRGRTCSANTLTVLIHRLRQKIDQESSSPLIHTVPGVGYVLKER
jgi:DNA-binding response OmpR family regulator